MARTDDISGQRGDLSVVDEVTVKGLGAAIAHGFTWRNTTVQEGGNVNEYWRPNNLLPPASEFR